MVLFRVETWSVSFRRFVFQLCQSTLAAPFPKDLWTYFRSRKLGFQIALPTYFCPVPVLSPLGLAFAQENQRNLAFSETSV